MKNLIVLVSLLMIGTAHAKSAVVVCSGQIEGKKESFKARIENDSIVWFSKKKLVDATKSSYFGWLANMDNFGLEGSGFYSGNGYSIMSVTNTAEKIEIGVHAATLSKGFFRYHDGGSGLGNSAVALTCKVEPKKEI